MRLTDLSLSHIRAHSQFDLSGIGDATLIVGKNGSGKSTILESIHLLSIGSSDRAERIEEIIQFGQELGRITTRIMSGGASVAGEESATLEVILTHGVVGGRRTQSRLWSVNDVRRTHAAVTQQIKSVLFRPEDMRLVEGSPGRRRNYCNIPISQVISGYARTLKAYEQFLLRRNKLLVAVREGEQQRSTLTYWTEGLLKHGEAVQEERRKFIAAINTYDLPLKFKALYVPSLLNAARLTEYSGREIAAGHTLIGPHKDDIDIDMSELVTNAKKPDFMSVLTYGSRGQQRLAVLWLKMAELAFVIEHSGEPPILLLDDIFSELDLDSQEIVLSMVPNQQTLLTTVEETDVGLYDWEVVRL